MADALEKARRKRITIRGLTTRILNKIKEGLDEQPVDVMCLEELCVQLEEKEQILLDLDETIENGIENLDDLEAEVLAAQEYRERIVSGKLRLQKRVKDAGSDKNENRTNMAGQVTTHSESNPVSTVRLPRLNIEKFNGDIASWQNFWAQFESAFHLKAGLSKVDKFNYLKSLLEGSAASAISGLPLTEANYDTAVSILKDRFGRKDVVVSAHVGKLLNISPVKKSSDITGLRNLYDLCEVQIRSLESAGVELKSYGSLLFPLLIKLIPDDITLEFNRRRKAEAIWNVSELLEFLKSEIENRERTILFSRLEYKENPLNPPQGTSNSTYKGKYPQKSEFSFRPGHRQNKLPSAAALGTVVESGCVFCRSTQHCSGDCDIKSVPERKSSLKRHGRCFLCLKGHHIVRFCKSKIFCEHCRGRHNSLICDRLDQPESGSTEPTVKTNAVVTSLSHGDDSTERVILLQTATALASGTGGKVQVRCLMDGGSQRTFIQEEISRRLQLPVTGEELITIHTFGETEPTKVLRRRVKLTLYNHRNANMNVAIEALETPSICSALIQMPGKGIREYFSKNGLELADSIEPSGEASLGISVLIGTDNYWTLVNGGMRRLSDSLVAIETILGWTVHGPTSTTALSMAQSTVSVMKTVTNSAADEELTSKTLKSFWELDSLGIINAEPNDIERERDNRVVDEFHSSLQFFEGRYVVKLPWKDQLTNLEDNLEIAERRFAGLVKKFKNDPDLYFRYGEVITSYLKKGIVEKVDLNKEESNNEQKGKKIYYMPHRAVIREDKATTKLRIVFDASSHSANSNSLNGCLEPGPNLNPDLLHLLIKFRLFPVAFIADIEQAFLQITLAKEDRDAARFIWLDGAFNTDGTVKKQILRMTRVLFGVTSSPFLLAATIKAHVSKYVEQYPEACKLLNESLYVDDLIGGAKDVEKALRVSNEIRSILQDANMNMRKWQTNSDRLQDKWNECTEMNAETQSTDICKNFETQKVLGLTWRTDSDTFVFDIASILGFLTSCQSTKRGILQAAGRIFDPVGFLNPFTIRVKMLFQELWVRAIEWDDNLPDDLLDEWKQWCFELPVLCRIAVPRYCFPLVPQVNSVQLHCFSDASEGAYGTALYMRTVSTSGTFSVVLLASKSRVAPLKRVTLPRLELMGALLSARLADHLLEILRESQRVTCFFWTDSMITLYWIKGTANRWKPFVKNRVAEIQSRTDPATWSHCPGDKNPADLLTRGIAATKLEESVLWWKGPEFLWLPEGEWPKGEPVVQTEETEIEARSAYQANCMAETKLSALLDINRYSTLSKLLRVTAWIKRFGFNALHRDGKNCGMLSAEELNEAEGYWIRLVQNEHFGDEISSLGLSKSVSSGSKIFSFNPILDEEGIIRVGGRLQESSLTFAQAHPILLPGDTQFSNLVIRANHERMGHAGVAETLTQVRDKYWILRGRQQVKTVINKCYICKKFKARPMVQDMAPLPSERITEAPAFEVTGVDFAGPLFVKIADKTEKSYIVLFTCAVTRAIHLELVTDMSAEKFLLALKRFIGRRGMCKVIFSDNAKTFKKTAKGLEEIWTHISDTEVQDYFGKSRISWKFIVERAAWWGGFWERLVRSVKTCLKKILGRASLGFQEMQTTLVEVEAILNSRPLTYVYNDVDEPFTLTPSHFLIGRRLTALPPDQIKKTQSSKSELTKRYTYRQSLLDKFWDRWRRTYLMDLRSAHKLTSPKGSTKLKENTVVLICEPKIPKMMWKMGVVQNVHLGRDKKVRSCDVRLPNGNIIGRPVQLLCPFELDEDST